MSEAAKTYVQLHVEVVAILAKYSLSMYVTAYSIDQVNSFLLTEPNRKLIQETNSFERMQKMILQMSPAMLFLIQPADVQKLYDIYYCMWYDDIGSAFKSVYNEGIKPAIGIAVHIGDKVLDKVGTVTDKLINRADQAAGVSIDSAQGIGKLFGNPLIIIAVIIGAVVVLPPVLSALK